MHLMKCVCAHMCVNFIQIVLQKEQAFMNIFNNQS